MRSSMDGVAAAAGHATLEGVKEAPCFYPTPAQFAEPLEYIASIRKEAEKHGICRICPPRGWKPQFAHKPDKLKFATKEQDLVSQNPTARARAPVKRTGRPSRCFRRHATRGRLQPSLCRERLLPLIYNCEFGDTTTAPLLFCAKNLIEKRMALCCASPLPPPDPNASVAAAGNKDGGSHAPVVWRLVLV